MCVCVRVALAKCCCGGQRTLLRRLFSFLTVCAPGIELGSSGWTADTVTCWAVSLTLCSQLRWNQVVHSLYEWVCVAGLFHLTQWSPSCLKWRASILGLTIRPWWVNTFALIVLSCQTFSVGSQSWLFWVVLWWGWEYGCLFCLLSSVVSLYLLKGQQLTETASRAGHCANLGLGMPYTLP